MPPARPDSEGDAGASKGPGKERDSRLISRDVLERFRRERIFLSVADLAHEGGPAALTTARIVKHGRMSRNTFYNLFADKADCLDLACEYARDQLTAPLRELLPNDGAERERLGRAISALVEAAAERPAVAELCLVHAPSVSSRGRELGVEAVIGAMIGAIEGDRGQAAGQAGIGEFVAATIVSIVVSRVRRGEGAELDQMKEELTDLAVRLWSEPGELVGAP